MATGSGTISDFSGAVSDLFGASADQSKAAGLRIKVKGDALEGQNYDLAATLAQQNEKYTEASTAIKQAQLDRSITQTIGGQSADVAAAGFSSSGSALDIMRDSASQGAITKAVAGQQGLITEAGYTEQAQSYQNMSKAAAFAVQGDNLAADAADKAAEGADITAGFKAVAGIASIALALPTGGASLAIGGAALSAVGDPNGIGGLY